MGDNQWQASPGGNRRNNRPAENRNNRPAENRNYRPAENRNYRQDPRPDNRNNRPGPRIDNRPGAAPVQGRAAGGPRRDDNGGRGAGFNGGGAAASVGKGMTFPLNIKPGSKAYRKYVDISFTFEKDGREITKNICDRKSDIRQRMLCYQCMYAAFSNAGAFKEVKGVEYTYDNMHTMYTSKRIKDFTYTVKLADIDAEYRTCLGRDQGELNMSIREADSGQVVDLCDLSQYQTDTILLQEDHTLRTVLELIVTDTALATTNFTLARGNDVYRNKEDYISRGLCTRLGTKKGVRIIKKDGRYLPALVVDTVHSPFYARERMTTFLDLVLAFVGDPRNANWEEATKFFKGIKVYPSYATHRVLQCAGFTPQTQGQLKVEKQTLVKYFMSTYNINLRRHDVPAMIAKNGAGNFPLECLYVVPSQLVDLEACPSRMRDSVHSQNAVLPHVRHDEIMNELQAMDITGDIGGAFGIDTATPMDNVNQLAFELPQKPRIQLGGGQNIDPAQDGTFRFGNGQFLKPAKIDRMAVLSTYRDKNLNDFVARFLSEGKIRGMEIKNANSIHYETLSGPSFDCYEKAFEKFKKMNITFVLMIGSVAEANSKNYLKLCESKHKIVTQLVTSEVAKNVVVKNQNVTLLNVLFKTNVKNGGLNYKPLFDTVGERFDINTGKVLILAYDVSHPGELDSALPQNQKEVKTVGKFPSVVGLVGNVIADPSAFVGNFFYQQSRKEEVISDVFVAYIKKMLAQLKENKATRCLPQTIIILRDGVSEGQFNMVVTQELPLIKRAFAEFMPNWKPKFLVAIVTKRHHKRFVKEDRTNAPVGSFVTDKVVRPDGLEFFMACHKAIKGTTKFVQVSIIHNEPNATTEELKPFLHSLSYGHQIVTSPVSLPTPVYQADDVATRGREVLNTLRRVRPNEIPLTVDGSVDFEALSRMLSYFDSPLAYKRCNA